MGVSSLLADGLQESQKKETRRNTCRSPSNRTVKKFFTVPSYWSSNLCRIGAVSMGRFLEIIIPAILEISANLKYRDTSFMSCSHLKESHPWGGLSKLWQLHLPHVIRERSQRYPVARHGHADHADTPAQPCEQFRELLIIDLHGRTPRADAAKLRKIGTADTEDEHT